MMSLAECPDVYSDSISNIVILLLATTVLVAAATRVYDVIHFHKGSRK
jgi:hypothetical protein